jgi:murein DD-endopeptidase MepM/ murein hydrolase activator NlpD
VRLALVAVFVLILTFAVVGCDKRGSDSGAASPAPDETTSSSPQQAETTQGHTAQGERQKDAFTPVTVSFVGSNSEGAFKGTDGRYHVVYELLLTNAKAVPATLGAVDVLDADDGTTVLRREGDKLVELIRTLNAQPAKNALIPPNQSRMVYLELRFDSEEAIPESLDHRFELKAAANPAATEPSKITYQAASLDLRDREVPDFAPPLKGEGWLAVNGCCGPNGVHRSSVQSVNAKLYDSQRFAIDWMRINADGQLIVGDPSKNENWVDYGAKVMAAADGEVIATLEDMKNNVPGKLPDPTTITIKTVDGNHVIIDHGDGFYSFYAHLQPGSVTVEVGDEVQTGDQLGLLGNTGNTSAPHLHFHVMSGPSALGSDGVPYVLDSFELAGRGTGAELDAAVSEGKKRFPSRAELDPAGRQDELPLDNAIVNFPSE